MHIYIHMGIYPLLSLLTIISKFPTLSKSQRTKRKINAFSIFGIFYTTHHHNEGRFPRCVFRHIIGVKDVAKIIKNYKSNNFYKKKYNSRTTKTFHAIASIHFIWGNRRSKCKSNENDKQSYNHTPQTAKSVWKTVPDS